MTRTNPLRIIFGVGLLCAICVAQETTPSEVFARVKSAYGSLQTYRAEGTVTVTAEVNAGAMTVKFDTSFSIVLKKPNLYLISWTQKNMPMPGMSQSGAVWSDGTQPYLFMADAYSKMTSDEMALASATGISGGAAFTVPSLFLPAVKDEAGWLSRLKDPKMEASETVGGEDCYVVSGSSSASTKEVFWISKSRSLILKFSRISEPPENDGKVPEASELTDQQLEEALKGMGQQVNEESKQKMKAFMKQSMAMISQMRVKSMSTELHTSISSPEISKQDFAFKLPDGAVLKDSLFDGILGGAKR